MGENAQLQAVMGDGVVGELDVSTLKPPPSISGLSEKDQLF